MSMARPITRLEHWLDTHSERFAVWLTRRTKGQAAWRLYHRRVVVLTTRGRRSGQDRTVLVQYFPDGEDLVVVAANGGMPAPPGWCFNLQAHPRARVEVEGRTIEVAAEELTPTQADAFWPRVLEAAPDYARYPRRTDRRIALFASPGGCRVESKTPTARHRDQRATNRVCAGNQRMTRGLSA